MYIDVKSLHTCLKQIYYYTYVLLMVVIAYLMVSAHIRLCIEVKKPNQGYTSSYCSGKGEKLNRGDIES